MQTWTAQFYSSCPGKNLGFHGPASTQYPTWGRQICQQALPSIRLAYLASAFTWKSSCSCKDALKNLGRSLYLEFRDREAQTLCRLKTSVRMHEKSRCLLQVHIGPGCQQNALEGETVVTVQIDIVQIALSCIRQGAAVSLGGAELQVQQPFHILHNQERKCGYLQNCTNSFLWWKLLQRIYHQQSASRRKIVATLKNSWRILSQDQQILSTSVLETAPTGEVTWVLKVLNPCSRHLRRGKHSESTTLPSWLPLKGSLLYHYDKQNMLF